MTIYIILQSIDSLFGVTLNNIPIFNLRIEYRKYLQSLQNEEFQSQFSFPMKPIKSPYFTWYGMPSTFLTIILRQAIIGLESYAVWVVYTEAGMNGLLNDDLIKRLRNPFSLGGRGTADNYYNAMPAIINEDYCLRICDNELWEKTKIFYAEIRNPIFHGNEIEVFSGFPMPVLHAYEFIGEIYHWFDSWFDIDEFMREINST